MSSAVCVYICRACAAVRAPVKGSMFRSFQGECEKLCLCAQSCVCRCLSPTHVWPCAMTELLCFNKCHPAHFLTNDKVGNAGKAALGDILSDEIRGLKSVCSEQTRRAGVALKPPAVGDIFSLSLGAFMALH